MAPLMILNPRKRKAGKTGAKRRRKMTAKQLKFFGPRKASKKKKKAAKAKVIIVESNPKGKAVAKKVRRHRRQKAKVFTSKKGTRRFRKNPRSIEAGFVNNTLLPAAIGAAGAIGTDMLINYLPIPVQFKSGMMLPVLKIAGALLVGAAVGAVSSREAGEEAAAGGVIVTLYGLSRGFINNANAAGAGMSRYVPMNGMGRYVPMNGFAPGAFNRGPQRQPGLGYNNPARISPPTRAQARFMSTR